MAQHKHRLWTYVQKPCLALQSAAMRFADAQLAGSVNAARQRFVPFSPIQQLIRRPQAGYLQ
eukprot:COSAG02_NODE_55094_length_292_cov_1.062176_1_plen_61_part_10